MSPSPSLSHFWGCRVRSSRACPNGTSSLRLSRARSLSVSGSLFLLSVFSVEWRAGFAWRLQGHPTQRWCRQKRGASTAKARVPRGQSRTVCVGAAMPAGEKSESATRNGLLAGEATMGRGPCFPHDTTRRLRNPTATCNIGTKLLSIPDPSISQHPRVYETMSTLNVRVLCTYLYIHDVSYIRMLDPFALALCCLDLLPTGIHARDVFSRRRCLRAGEECVYSKRMCHLPTAQQQPTPGAVVEHGDILPFKR